MKTPHVLIPHPVGAPLHAVKSVAARVAIAGATLRFEYRLTGDLVELAIPPRAPPRRAERLWEHTCFEAFVAAGTGAGYYELNFAPSGQWAAYEFDGYRERMRAVELAHAPLIDAADDGNELRVTGSVEIATFAAALWPWRVGLTAVVADRSGRRGYYALRHMRDTPDFHDAASFALSLDGSAR
jgi:hypothetical protein